MNIPAHLWTNDAENPALVEAVENCRNAQKLFLPTPAYVILDPALRPLYIVEVEPDVTWYYMTVNEYGPCYITFPTNDILPPHYPYLVDALRKITLD